MTVFDNIAYGLRIKKLPPEEIRRRVKWALELVKLEGLENRYPLQLSGGQQQRVALARALVVEPRVLLLDEPLSNLDAKLRIEMREEIKKLQRKLGITTVYVTHDQLEAMSISDRIAVMNKGRVLQYGSPRQVYFRPTSLFVADFLGRSNILYGKAGKQHDGYIDVYIPDLDATLTGVPVREITGLNVAVVIRPEIARLVEKHEVVENKLVGRIDLAMFLGDKVELRVGIGKTSLIIYMSNLYEPTPGSEITFYLPKDSLIVLPVEKPLNRE